MSLKEEIANINIPTYSHKQEMFNSISHFLGLPLAVTVLVTAFIKFFNGSISSLVLSGLIIFSVSMFLVYAISSVYHGMKRDSFAKKIFRVIDHCTIYLLIAGTYTPVCFSMFSNTSLGIIMFIIEWMGALIGIGLTIFLFNNKIARFISFILYIVMGWLCAFVGGWLYLPLNAFLLILIGGIVYSIGSILYACGHAKKWFHCLFHVFVLTATIIQTIGVLSLY